MKTQPNYNNMNDKGMPDLQQLTEAAVQEMTKHYCMKVEEFTEKQVAEIITQMIASGDFTRNVSRMPDGKTGHSVTYFPFREKYRLESELETLKENLQQYVQATKALVADYKESADSGDWGFWEFEDQKLIIAYREAEKNLDSILNPHTQL